jgi:hypothetical protein
MVPAQRRGLNATDAPPLATGLPQVDARRRGGEREITAERERIDAEHLRLGLERAEEGDVRSPDR